MTQARTQTGVPTPFQPIRDNQGASILGPTNPPREAQDPDLLVPPQTDHGTLPNLRWSFADSHNHLSEGGWARQTTICEVLIVVDNAHFDSHSTFLLTDWLAHTPREVLAANFEVPESAFDNLPDHELYIFNAPVPGPLNGERIPGAEPVPEPFTHHLLAQEPVRTKGGSFRVADSRVFKASKTIAAALIEIEPGGIRELHWHPIADEWLYFLSGEARMGVFDANGDAGTFDYQAGDVGYVPRPMGHYVVNRGTTTLRFLGAFRSDRVVEASLSKWLALTPHELVRAHLNIDEAMLAKIPLRHTPIVPV